MAYAVIMATPAAVPSDMWEQTPPEAQAYIRTLEARLAALESMIQALQEQNRALQEQRNQTSRNSFRPPSSDPPQSHRPHRPRGQRRRGGQPGHPGHTRPLIPVEDVDAVVVLKPEQCRGCHALLSGDDLAPFRHHVIEIPPIQPVMTEYQWHQLLCPECGATTRTPWPAGVPSGTYGARVQAPVALCPGAYRLSTRTTQQVLDEVFGVPRRVGTISQSEQITTEVLTMPVEEARAHVQEQAVAHVDETSWRQGDQRAWLWVAVSSMVTVLLIRMSRGGHVARELLGERCAGILVTDRSSAYNWYPVRWRQVCWAHL
jgi:transposase